jgi:hypothetical protein
MAASQGKVETVGPQGFQLFVFDPGKFDGGKRTAAFASALTAALRISERAVQQNAVPPDSLTAERKFFDGISPFGFTQV